MKQAKEVKLDVLGRVCIPKGMRETLGWDVNTDVYVELFDDRLVVSKKNMTQECPVCKRVFTSEYEFCPFCGQYLQEKQTEETK